MSQPITPSSPSEQSNDASRLRLGVVVDAWEQPAWVLDAVRDALESGNVVAAWIARVAASEPSAAGPSGGARRGLVQRVFDAFDAARFPVVPDVLALGDLRSLVRGGDTSVMEWDPARTVPLPGAADLVLNCSARVETRLLASGARYGAASFEIGETRGALLEHAGFGEVMRGSSVIGARLVYWAAGAVEADAICDTITS
ncbi:MAG TPA: hypothetical protein VFV33_26165, partial [Gemmatimonadaceae bacterium]|nr:hypothetical protein [Gemmatimonadaceae bacterium]